MLKRMVAALLVNGCFGLDSGQSKNAATLLKTDATAAIVGDPGPLSNQTLLNDAY